MRKTIGALGLLAVTMTTLGIVAPHVTPAYAAKRTIKQLTGTVVGVDTQANTVTVEHAGKLRHTRRVFNVAPDAAGVLGQLKPGERVTVKYERDHGNLTAESITPSGRS
jgi:Cu/Ag efflux protein CusF